MVNTYSQAPSFGAAGIPTTPIMPDYATQNAHAGVENAASLQNKLAQTRQTAANQVQQHQLARQNQLQQMQQELAQWQGQLQATLETERQSLTDMQQRNQQPNMQPYGPPQGTITQPPANTGPASFARGGMVLPRYAGGGGYMASTISQQAVPGAVVTGSGPGGNTVWRVFDGQQWVDFPDEHQANGFAASVSAPNPGYTPYTPYAGPPTAGGPMPPAPPAVASTTTYTPYTPAPTAARPHPGGAQGQDSLDQPTAPTFGPPASLAYTPPVAAAAPVARPAAPQTTPAAAVQQSVQQSVQQAYTAPPAPPPVAEAAPVAPAQPRRFPQGMTETTAKPGAGGGFAPTTRQFPQTPAEATGKPGAGQVATANPALDTSGAYPGQLNGAMPPLPPAPTDGQYGAYFDQGSGQWVKPTGPGSVDFQTGQWVPKPAAPADTSMDAGITHAAPPAQAAASAEPSDEMKAAWAARTASLKAQGDPSGYSAFDDRLGDARSMGRERSMRGFAAGGKEPPLPPMPPGMDMAGPAGLPTGPADPAGPDDSAAPNAIVGEGPGPGGTRLELAITPDNKIYWTDDPVAANVPPGTVMVPVMENPKLDKIIKSTYPQLPGEPAVKDGGTWQPQSMAKGGKVRSVMPPLPPGAMLKKAS